MTSRIVFFAAVVCSGSAFAAELAVPAQYPTIQKAVDAAKGGDVVLVKAGTYAGFRVQKLCEGTPLTIKAAPGERVTISGMQKIEGWKDEGGGVFSAKVPSRVDSLFVGYVEQQCGRWPADGTRLPILTADAATCTFKTAPVADPKLAKIAKDPKDTRCYFFFAAGNAFSSRRIQSYDPKTGDIVFSPEEWMKWIKPENNRYSFVNHPALVDLPGSWAFVSELGGDPKSTAGTVYFKPAKRADLSKAQYCAADRQLVAVGHHKNPTGNVVIDGFEIAGSRAAGVQIGGNGVTVQNCLVHHNGGGIAARVAKDVKVLSNLIVANRGTGIGLASVENALVEGNEVALNLEDGIVVAGNISGRKTGTPGANPPTKHVVVRRNYIHHHIYQAHPDNTQMYRDVSDVVYEENFNICGGQSIMAEEAEDVTVRGNLFMGCDAVMLICGHGNSHRWKFEGNTLWGAGYGFFSFTGHDYTVSKNLIIGGSMDYGQIDSTKVESSGNRFAPSYFARTAKPWRKYTDLSMAQSELGQEKGSSIVTMPSSNFPCAHAVSSANGSSLDSLALRKDAAARTDLFAPGDRIELNCDGVLRTVRSCANGVLSFSPALETPPYRGVMVFNWKTAKTVDIDIRPVDGCGSPISPAAFRKGDLLGAGRRTIPAIPADVAEGIPSPNRPVIPPKG